MDVVTDALTSKVHIALIFARAENGVIGAKGALPWHLPADLQHFKRHTLGKPVIMGRKTFDSIGKALPRRLNIVVTRDRAWSAENIAVAPDLPSALALGYEEALRTGADEVMVIGGAEIFHRVLPQASRIYLTEVHRDYAGDVIFNVNADGAWRELSRERHEGEGGGPAYSFVTLARVPLNS
jgi:dihydrofolate reductase